MRVLRETVKNSPYLGIFCAVSEKTALVPESIEKKELKKMQEALEVEAIKTSIASSSLIGVLCKGNSEGFVVPEIIEKEELKKLENQGVKVKVIKGNLALGNLIAANDKKALLSPMIPKKCQKEISEFLNVEALQTKIAGNELTGSSAVVSNSGFIINMHSSQKEFDKIKKFLTLEGKATTANYGDPFVGNSVIANSKAIIAGSLSTTVEILKIQEGLGA